MKKKVLILVLSIFVFTATNAQKSLSNYYGNWVNVDSNTRGITKLKITRNGETPYMQVYGSCSPRDCDWGKVKSKAYTSSVSGNPLSNTIALLANFNAIRSIKNMVVVKSISRSMIQVTTFTDFTNGRKSYTKTYRFKRSNSTASVSCGKEDCISINPKGSLRVIKNSKGTYSVVQGSHYIFSAPNTIEANKIIQLIRRYGFTSSCFVGRPNPNFSYQLVNGKASRVQPASGEDIIRFNPAKIEVKNVGGRWKIVEGSHWMFDFDKNKKEAEKALCIIKKYGFNAIGYVGRPKASLQYLVKRN